MIERTSAQCSLITEIVNENDVSELMVLRRNWQRLNEAQALARIGSWESDITTGTRRWSDELFRIFGLLPASEPPAMEEWMRAVPPEDHVRIKAMTQQAITTGEPQELEFQILLPHGETRAVHSLIRAVRDMQGCIVRLIGTIRDITEQRQTEQRARIQSEVTRLLEANPFSETASALLQTIGARSG